MVIFLQASFKFYVNLMLRRLRNFESMNPTLDVYALRVIENTPRHDMLLEIGDINAKVGRGLDGDEEKKEDI